MKHGNHDEAQAEGSEAQAEADEGVLMDQREFILRMTKYIVTGVVIMFTFWIASTSCS